MSELENLVIEVAKQNILLGQRLDQQNVALGQRIDAVYQRMEQQSASLGQRIDATNQRIDASIQRMEATNQRMDQSMNEIRQYFWTLSNALQKLPDAVKDRIGFDKK